MSPSSYHIISFNEASPAYLPRVPCLDICLRSPFADDNDIYQGMTFATSPIAVRQYTKSTARDYVRSIPASNDLLSSGLGCAACPYLARAGLHLLFGGRYQRGRFTVASRRAVQQSGARSLVTLFSASCIIRRRLVQ
nr:hypothetical protein CFP56_03280 [Quercus suber]